MLLFRSGRHILKDNEIFLMVPEPGGDYYYYYYYYYASYDYYYYYNYAPYYYYSTFTFSATSGWSKQGPERQRWPAARRLCS